MNVPVHRNASGAAAAAVVQAHCIVSLLRTVGYSQLVTMVTPH